MLERELPVTQRRQLKANGNVRRVVFNSANASSKAHPSLFMQVASIASNTAGSSVGSPMRKGRSKTGTDRAAFGHSRRAKVMYRVLKVSCRFPMRLLRLSRRVGITFLKRRRSFGTVLHWKAKRRIDISSVCCDLRNSFAHQVLGQIDAHAGDG